MSNKMLTKLVSPVCLIMTLAMGCASVPVIRAWRPWVQTNREPRDIPVHSTIALEVEGETQPLIGDEKLREEAVKSEVSRLLARRGFVVSDSATDFTIALTYKTAERESFSMSSFSSSTQSSFLSLIGGAGSSSSSKSGALVGGFGALGLSRSRSWGVALAQAVAQQFMSNISESHFRKRTQFVHILALKIMDTSRVTFWNTDAMWEADSPNLLTNLTPALQTILVNLPLDTGLVPRVPLVEESRAVNYQQLFTEGVWFSCPSLPYRAAFPSPRSYKHYYNADDADPIKSPAALPAFVDLVQTAEVALPQGSGKWKDPLNPNLWSKVLLGGKYFLGPNDSLVYVFVKLKGSYKGYNIDKCWIAEESEYMSFVQKLAQWRQAVADFADVYKKQ